MQNLDPLLGGAWGGLSKQVLIDFSESICRAAGSKILNLKI